jgi:peptidoglycan/LPS O-acetylase OafA/YrhL
MIAEPRYRSLDILRGLAAILVIFFHINWNNHLTGTHFFRHSFLFVDLFFILSGFIISIVYSGRIFTITDATRFMILRFFRLYPLHLVTLLVLVAIESTKYILGVLGLISENAQFAYQRTVPSLFANLLFLQGSGILTQLSWNTPSWSISCEMFAYVAFASFAIFGWLRTGLTSWLIIPIVCGYSYLAITRGTLNVTFDIGIIRCLCSFGLGMVIARLPPAPFPSAIAIVSAAVAIFLMATQNGALEFLIIPPFATLIYALRDDQCLVSRRLQTRLGELLGRISFSIYMVHYTVISLIGTALKVLLKSKSILRDGWEVPTFDISPILGDVLIVVGVAMSLASAFYTYRWIEAPGRQYGYRVASRLNRLGEC